MDLPLDGAISRYFHEDAPEDVRRLIKGADKDDVLNPRFPYPEEMGKKAYEAEMEALQVELVRFQAWVKEAGARVLVVFEGRDAAGKGGAIKAFTENLNPRGARTVDARRFVQILVDLGEAGDEKDDVISEHLPDVEDH